MKNSNTLSVHTKSSVSIQKIFLSLFTLITTFFILSIIIPKVIVGQQYAACTGYTFAYNECERGNATACRSVGVGNVAGVYKNAAGAYCCTNTGQVCNGGVAVTTNNGSGGSVGGGKITTIVTTPKATVGEACGTNGTGKCSVLGSASTVNAGYAGASCDATTQGVCSAGGAGLVCCSPKSIPAQVQLGSTSKQNVVGGSKVQGAQAYVTTGTVTYDTTSGGFINPDFSITNVPAGDYFGIIHVEGHLDKQITNSKGNIFSITSGQKSISINPVIPQSGDVAPYPNGDNYVDLQDYNYIMGCLNMKDSDKATTTCPNPMVADLNKDGVVDQKDIAIIAGSFGTKGDFFAEKQSLYTCVTDPTCASSGNTLQLCTLKCTKNAGQ